VLHPRHPLHPHETGVTLSFANSRHPNKTRPKDLRSAAVAPTNRPRVAMIQPLTPT
jgi:hypothetical protein